MRLLLILTAQLGLATKQVDYAAAFAHADIDLPPNCKEMSACEKARQGVSCCRTLAVGPLNHNKVTKVNGLGL